MSRFAVVRHGEDQASTSDGPNRLSAGEEHRGAADTLLYIVVLGLDFENIAGEPRNE